MFIVREENIKPAFDYLQRLMFERLAMESANTPSPVLLALSYYESVEQGRGPVAHHEDWPGQTSEIVARLRDMRDLGIPAVDIATTEAGTLRSDLLYVSIINELKPAREAYLTLLRTLNNPALHGLYINDLRIVGVSSDHMKAAHNITAQSLEEQTGRDPDLIVEKIAATHIESIMDTAIERFVPGQTFTDEYKKNTALTAMKFSLNNPDFATNPLSEPSPALAEPFATMRTEAQAHYFGAMGTALRQAAFVTAQQASYPHNAALHDSLITESKTLQELAENLTPDSCIVAYMAENLVTAARFTQDPGVIAKNVLKGTMRQALEEALESFTHEQVWPEAVLEESSLKNAQFCLDNPEVAVADPATPFPAFEEPVYDELIGQVRTNFKTAFVKAFTSASAELEAMANDPAQASLSDGLKAKAAVLSTIGSKLTETSLVPAFVANSFVIGIKQGREAVAQAEAARCEAARPDAGEGQAQKAEPHQP